MTQNPFSKRHWNVTRQMLLHRDDPEYARQLERHAAGERHAPRHDGNPTNPYSRAGFNLTQQMLLEKNDPDRADALRRKLRTPEMNRNAFSTKGWSHRQERAKIVRDSQKASEEIRSARSVLLARQDLQRQQQEALGRVAQARARFEAFDPANHKLALAEAVREAEDIASALQTTTESPSSPKKGK